MFYDINKGSKHDPIQVLKGGSHPWFVPDSISVNQDYFAVSGRKPSAVFVWNWRKGVRLSNRVYKYKIGVKYYIHTKKEIYDRLLITNLIMFSYRGTI